jgi:hypothetical protein
MVLVGVEASVWLRNYPLILILRKPFIAGIYVLAYSDKFFCASLLFVLSFVYFIYGIRFNPFKTGFERKVNIFIET